MMQPRVFLLIVASITAAAGLKLEAHDHDAASLSVSGSVDCSQLVTPVDIVPIRSPTAVHSFLAEYVRGKSILEIGTRNGDGMNCFARTASSAVAVEFSTEYCGKLRTRADSLRQETNGKGYDVICDKFPDGNRDVDVITWW